VTPRPHQACEPAVRGVSRPVSLRPAA
jgi:hypothetical protein